MSDALIPDIPDDVLAVLDQLAARLGLSRTEYIRQRLAQDARAAKIAVTRDDWRRFADSYSHLADPSVMMQAWE